MLTVVAGAVDPVTATDYHPADEPFLIVSGGVR